jgi:hypothetical protein
LRRRIGALKAAFTPDSVYQAIASLRRQLGDNPKQPTYIATVPRLGYRMAATVARGDLGLLEIACQRHSYRADLGILPVFEHWYRLQRFFRARGFAGFSSSFRHALNHSTSMSFPLGAAGKL